MKPAFERLRRCPSPAERGKQTSSIVAAKRSLAATTMGAR